MELSKEETGGIAIWYLGQAGFLLQHSGTSIAIDPYLSYAVDKAVPDGSMTRLYPPPVRPEELTSVDLVLCTHDHLDHSDPETLRGIALAAPAAQFAGPAASLAKFKEAGIAEAKTIMLCDGTPFRFREVTIEPISSAHEEHEKDADGYDLFLGYLLTWAGVTIYHSGDTVVTPQLSSRLAVHRIDLGVLPINGRDDARRRENIVGNMNAAEAVQFAADQDFGVVVPMHHDLYSKNGAPLADFIAAWEAVPLENRPGFKAFFPGERMLIGPAPGKT